MATTRVAVTLLKVAQVSKPGGQDFMGKRLALLAIRLLVSLNLLYAAIFLKFAGCKVRWSCLRRCRTRSTGWYLSRYSGQGQGRSRRWWQLCSLFRRAGVDEVNT